MEHTTTPQTTTTTNLRAYPGWAICHNLVTDVYWAISLRGPAIGPGEDTFAAALQFVKDGGEVR